jgi:uncharacterized protein (UPF0303 family)
MSGTLKACRVALVKPVAYLKVSVILRDCAVRRDRTFHQRLQLLPVADLALIGRGFCIKGERAIWFSFLWC